MKVTLKCGGYVRGFFEREREDVDLPENSTLQDLLQWIEEHRASRFPPRLWDFEQHRFRDPVVLVLNGETASASTTPLQESEEIVVLYPVAGG
jgi:molybdopterin converting factor small subunit